MMVACGGLPRQTIKAVPPGGPSCWALRLPLSAACLSASQGPSCWPLLAAAIERG